MKKRYYIVKSGKGFVERYVGFYTNKRDADSVKVALTAGYGDKYAPPKFIFWVDFEWT